MDHDECTDKIVEQGGHDVEVQATGVWPEWFGFKPKKRDEAADINELRARIKRMRAFMINFNNYGVIPTEHETDA
jgi:hypothetical protein